MVALKFCPVFAAFPSLISASVLTNRRGNTSCGTFILECCEALGSTSSSEVVQALASIGVTSVPAGLVGFTCLPVTPCNTPDTSVCCSNAQFVAQFGIALGCAPLNK